MLRTGHRPVLAHGAAGIFPAVVREAAGGARGGAIPSEAKSNGARYLPEVEAHITGTVWKIECQIGQEVEEGDTLVILESMKMEMPVEAEDEGTVKEIVCQEGQSVSEGDTLVVLE